MRHKSSGSSGGAVTAAATTVAALAATALTRRALKSSWRVVTGEPAPSDPRSRDTDWMVAVLWAMASGAAIGVTRLLVERQVARLAKH